MGEEIEIIPKSKKGIFVNSHFTFCIEIRKYPPVLSQQTVYIPYEVIRITVQPVVIIITTLIRTEFLIGATFYYVAAIETFLFHSTNISIKI
jgi:hypothetical protein